MSDDRVGVIRLDQAHAVGLVEVLELGESWLAGAGPTLGADSAPFVGPQPKHYPLSELGAEVIAGAARLALAPGEAR